MADPPSAVAGANKATAKCCYSRTPVKTTSYPDVRFSVLLALLSLENSESTDGHLAGSARRGIYTCNLPVRTNVRANHSHLAKVDLVVRCWHRSSVSYPHTLQIWPRLQAFPECALRITPTGYHSRHVCKYHYDTAVRGGGSAGQGGSGSLRNFSESGASSLHVIATWHPRMAALGFKRCMCFSTAGLQDYAEAYNVAVWDFPQVWSLRSESPFATFYIALQNSFYCAGSRVCTSFGSSGPI